MKTPCFVEVPQRSVEYRGRKVRHRNRSHQEPSLFQDRSLLRASGPTHRGGTSGRSPDPETGPGRGRQRRPGPEPGDAPEADGHEVQLAHDGPGALEATAAFNPDVALVDIGLPGLNGYEVARRIRENPQLRGVVLVAQTGWGQDEDRRRSVEAGFDYHLVKPVDLEALRKILAAPRPTR
ncbi:MAG TPA: response regulator [Gemmataceae bacterium]|nr:response regulator [Gemmataceae bacterium]